MLMIGINISYNMYIFGHRSSDYKCDKRAMISSLWLHHTAHYSPLVVSTIGIQSFEIICFPATSSVHH